MTTLLRLLCILLLLTVRVFAATTANNDSCDIGIAPAATLLLPYFEVAPDRARESTLFTVTNVTSKSHIARVTLWTDFAYPVVAFDLLFEPYELHRINLYDVIWRGVLDATNESDVCGLRSLSEHDVARVQSAFTLGRITATDNQPGCATVGNPHVNGYSYATAVGYVTVDVVGACASGTTPLDARHFAEDLRFDNVFIGDYQQFNADQAFGQGNPMVHIRAMPEGGTPQSRRNNPDRYKSNLPHTFYGRFQDPAHPTADARQPLPSQFAMRWVNVGWGSPFQTSFKIWHDGATKINAPCTAYPTNGELQLLETVVFDEDENGEGTPGPECIVPTCLEAGPIKLPATSRTSIGNSKIFPQDLVDTETTGWVYINFDPGVSPFPARQAWIVVSMRAEDRYSIDFDAAALGNGCTPAKAPTEFSDAGIYDSADVLPGPAPDYVP